jgi:hypothetical protein
MSSVTTTLTTTGGTITEIDLAGVNDSTVPFYNTTGYVQPNYCYPYPQPWGGWYPAYPYWSVPYYPHEIDRIADKVAEKLAAKRRK